MCIWKGYQLDKNDKLKKEEEKSISNDDKKEENIES